MPHQADECGARIDGELSGLSLLVLRLPEANLDEFVALEGGVDGAQAGRGDAAIPHLYQGAQRVGASAQEAPLQSRELRGGGHAGSIAPTDDRRHSAQSGWGRVGVSRREVVVAFLERVTGFAVTPAGAALDRFCVRWLGHSLVSWLFARGSGQAYNVPLLLTATGRSSGLPRSVVLPYFPAGAAIAVVGSKGGLPEDPHWVKNLRAEPRCEIYLWRRRHRKRARIAAGEERAGLWREISARAPVYLDYQERARGHREIPVVILEPEG